MVFVLGMRGSAASSNPMPAAAGFSMTADKTRSLGSCTVAFSTN